MTTILRRRLAKVQTSSSYLALWHAQSISHSREICPRSDQEKGYFKACEESSKAYLENCKLVKQANAHLAKLDGTTSKATGSSEKPTKKPKETTAVASPADPALRAE
jgi:hypothetical protein